MNKPLSLLAGLLIGITTHVTYAQSQDVNHIISIDYLREGITETTDLSTLNNDEYLYTINYLDGLGRPIQQVQMGGSSTPGQDIVIPYEYDPYGRMLRDYLPYATNTRTGNYRQNAVAAQGNFYAETTNNVVTDSYPYAEKRLEKSPRARVLEQGAPGMDWQLGNHSVKFEYGFNENGEVRKWEYDELLTGNAAFYEANELHKTTTWDEDGNETIEYVDKEGKTVLKKSYEGSGWAETCYIYDDFDRLRIVLPPQAVANLNVDFFGKTAQERQDFLDVWAFQYRYDGEGRMIEKKVPGAGVVYLVYDPWDRLVLTQDEVQRTSNTWLFTCYDAWNRPVMNGLIEETLPYTDLQAHVASLQERYLTYSGDGPYGYEGLAYPFHESGGEIAEVLTVNYYDHYDFVDNTGLSGTAFQPVYTTSDAQHILPVYNPRVRGQMTGTLTKEGGGSEEDYLATLMYYDEKYRPIQIVSENHLGGIDVVSNQYDFTGMIRKSQTEHTVNEVTTTIKRRFAYDHQNRLTNTWHQINGEEEVMLASNQYNELGELIEKNLHSTDQGTSFRQSIDYLYNVRGWLVWMNGSDLSLSPEGDIFGMELFYNLVDPDLNNTPLYNGNIGAMKWSTPRDIKSPYLNERGYRFQYDGLNRLTNAFSHRQWAGWSATNQYRTDYGYDLNGNIQWLNRRGIDGNLMDDLWYVYQGNQLLKVTDQAPAPGGFEDGNTTGNDYLYDRNGSMAKDRNKDIDTIYYNHLNLPVKVMFDTPGDHIGYMYDGAGTKLRETVHEGGKVKVTDYVGEFIYEDEELQLIQHEEGRIIPKGGGESYDYQYHLKDHLGNVRVTFSTMQEAYLMIATMENGNEANNFANYVATPSAVAAKSGTNVFRSSNTVNGGLGMNTFLRVNQGDTIRTEAYAYYSDNGSSYSLVVGAIEAALFGAFSSNYGVEGATVTQTNFDDAFGMGTLLNGRSSTSDAPRAYINYIFFDEGMNYMSAGFKQISTSANGSHEHIVMDEFVADREGYVFIYLSNETAGPEVVVSFDDLKVYHGKTNVVGSQDYYPFGLVFNSYTRIASTAQNYKFGAKEEQKETGLIDFGARSYDPAIGKFIQIDPMAHKFANFTPYNYAVDNPIMFIDPNGMEAYTYNWDEERYEDEDGNEVGWDEVNESIQEESGPTNVLVTGKSRKKKDGSTDWALEGVFQQADNMSSFTVIQADNAKDAYGQMQSLVDGGATIGNVIFDSHGDYNVAGFKIGNGGWINSRNGNLGNQWVRKIGELFSPDTEVLLLACHAGAAHNGGKEFVGQLSAAWGGATIYASQSWTGAKPGIFTGLVSPSYSPSPGRFDGREKAYQNVGLWSKASGGSVSQVSGSMYITIHGAFESGRQVQRRKTVMEGIKSFNRSYR